MLNGLTDSLLTAVRLGTKLNTKITKSLTALIPESVALEKTAFFFDFDGTLAPIATHPDRVRLATITRETLRKIFELSGGALAIITGRDIGDVDKMVAPLHVPVAGVHGLTRRSTDGTIHNALVNNSIIAELNDRLKETTDEYAGLLLERKNGSVALHYRNRPDLEYTCIELMDEAVRQLEGIHVIRGKMVIEAKPDTSNKGGALEDFMNEAPFVGRTPLFAGDDVTDEDAFVVVNSRGGISVKVGLGETLACYRTSDMSEFLNWLERLAGLPKKEG